MVTHPTRYESKPVLEITMFMSLSSQHFVQLTVQVGGYNHIHVVHYLCEIMFWLKTDINRDLSHIRCQKP